MQMCPKCGIRIVGNKMCCPLCQGKLRGEPDQGAFPILPERRVTGISVVRLLAFLTVAAEIITCTIWYLLSVQAGLNPGWIPLLMAGFAVGFLDFLFAFYLRNNVLKTVTAQIYFAMIVGYVIDRMTGFQRWSVEWMIPLTFLGLGFLTIILGRMIGRRFEEYIFYLISDTVVCIVVQMIWIVRGTNNFVIPAAISMALYLIMAVGTVIFFYRDLKNATAKIFNI